MSGAHLSEASEILRVPRMDRPLGLQPQRPWSLGELVSEDHLAHPQRRSGSCARAPYGAAFLGADLGRPRPAFIRTVSRSSTSTPPPLGPRSAAWTFPRTRGAAPLAPPRQRHPAAGPSRASLTNAPASGPVIIAPFTSDDMASAPLSSRSVYDPPSFHSTAELAGDLPLLAATRTRLVVAAERAV